MTAPISFGPDMPTRPSTHHCLGMVCRPSNHCQCRCDPCAAQRQYAHDWDSMMMHRAAMWGELHAAYLAQRKVVVAASQWLDHLESRGGHFFDGVPGELMDAGECLRGSDSL